MLLRGYGFPFVTCLNEYGMQYTDRTYKQDRLNSWCHVYVQGKFFERRI